jgi:hypothetical protein
VSAQRRLSTWTNFYPLCIILCPRGNADDIGRPDAGLGRSDSSFYPRTSILTTLLRDLARGVNIFGGTKNGSAFFALDQSRAAMFIDRASNQPGAGLEEIFDVLANNLRNMDGPSIQALNLASIPF